MKKLYSWSKEEDDFAVKSIKSSTTQLEALQKIQNVYPHRNLNMVQHRLNALGLTMSSLLMRESAAKVSERMELTSRQKEEIRDLKEQLAVLRTETKDTQAIIEMIHGLGKHDFMNIPKWIHRSRERSVTGIPYLLLSDIHHGEVIDSSQINFMNTFNREISRKRLEHTFKTAVDLCMDFLSKPKYEGIVCALNGDMISGNIHEELAETNEGPVLESVIEMSEILIQGITLLANVFKKVYVPCIVGNHGRVHHKPRAKNKVRDNYEWLIYNYIFKHFEKDDRVNVVIPNSTDIRYTIYGTTFLQTHGDQFKGGTGIAGMFSPLMLGQARKQMRNQSVKQGFDVMVIGHWHQYIHTEKLIVNGSSKGYDEYAYHLNLPFEPPKQALFVCHPDFGITFRMPIFCDPKYSISQSRRTYTDPLWRRKDE